MPTLARPSVASLLIQMRFQTQLLATGTGFLVQRADQLWLVTNRHNLRGRHQETNQPLNKHGAIPDEVVIYHNAGGQVGTWIDRVEPLWDATGQSLWREHPILGGAADVVALPLTLTTSIDAYPYDPWSPGFNIMLEPSQRLSIVGFPFGLTAGGLFAVWIGGTVASEPAVDFNNRPIFLVDSRTRPGQSGSPVIYYATGGTFTQASGGMVTYAGTVEEFVGVYSGRINDQSDLGFVWKRSVVCEIVDSGAPGTL
jgi:hypothetical protein